MITVLRIGRRWLSGSARTLWHKMAATVPAGPGPLSLGYFIQLFVTIAGGGGEFHYRDTGRSQRPGARGIAQDVTGEGISLSEGVGISLSR